MSESSFPQGWHSAELGDLLEVYTGKLDANAAEENGEYPFFTCAEQVSRINTFAFDTDAVLLAGNGSFGVKHYSGKFNAYQRTYVLESKVVSIKFLYWLIRSSISKITSSERGSTIPYIRKGDITDISVLLPPLNEQTRIANKLDELLAQVDTIKARVDAIPTILKRFRQSVLAAAVSGKLTEEWRGVNGADKWKDVKLSELCKSISDGDHQAPPKVDMGVPFFVISNVSKGFLDFEAVGRWVPQDYFDSLGEVRVPKKNDILYTVTGSYGIPVVVDSSKSFCFQRHIGILKPNHDLVNYRYLFRVLQSPDIFTQATAVATGTAQKTVPLGGLRNFSIPYPSLVEQEHIVKRLEQLFAFADQIEQRVKEAQTRIDSLSQSILAKAFRGELVPQDPNDEPASELLARIQKEREEAAVLAKAAKKAAKAKTAKASRK